jgi:transcriptional regulator with XRE-family HTH domain
LREHAELTQEQVAEKSESGLHPTWLSRLEQGRVNPTAKTLKNIADGIGITPSRILSLSEALAEMSQG